MGELYTQLIWRQSQQSLLKLVFDLRIFIHHTVGALPMLQ